MHCFLRECLHGMLGFDFSDEINLNWSYDCNLSFCKVSSLKSKLNMINIPSKHSHRKQCMKGNSCSLLFYICLHIYKYRPRKLKRGIGTHFCRNVIAMEIRHLGLSLMEGELLYFRHSPVRVWHFATEIPGKFAYMIRASRNTRCWKRRHGEIAHAVCAWDQDLRDLTNSGLVYEKIRKYNNSAPWATTKWRRVLDSPFLTSLVIDGLFIMVNMLKLFTM